MENKINLFGHISDKEFARFLLAEQKYEDTIIYKNIQTVISIVSEDNHELGEKFIVELQAFSNTIKEIHVRLHEQKNRAIQNFGHFRWTIKSLERLETTEERKSVIKNYYKIV